MGCFGMPAGMAAMLLAAQKRGNQLTGLWLRMISFSYYRSFDDIAHYARNAGAYYGELCHLRALIIYYMLLHTAVLCRHMYKHLLRHYNFYVWLKY